MKDESGTPRGLDGLTAKKGKAFRADSHCFRHSIIADRTGAASPPVLLRTSTPSLIG
jgi:hypothetical protein